MDTPIYDQMAFTLDYNHVHDYYWYEPWLEFVRIAESINRIGCYRKRYLPICVTIMFANGDDGGPGVALI